MLVLTLLFLLLCVGFRCWPMEERPVLVSSGSLIEQPCVDNLQPGGELTTNQIELFQKVIERATIALRKEKEKNIQEKEQIKVEHDEKIKELMHRIEQLSRTHQECLDVESEKIKRYEGTLIECDKEIERQAIALDANKIRYSCLESELKRLQDTVRLEKEFTVVSSSPPRVTISSLNPEAERLRKENSCLRTKIEELEKIHDDEPAQDIRQNAQHMFALESCANFSALCNYLQESDDITALSWIIKELKINRKTSHERSPLTQEQFNQALIRFAKKYTYPLCEAVAFNLSPQLYTLLLQHTYNKVEQVNAAVGLALHMLGTRDNSIIELIKLSCTEIQCTESIKKIFLTLIDKRELASLEHILNNIAKKHLWNNPAMLAGLAVAFFQIIKEDYELEWMLFRFAVPSIIKNKLYCDDLPLIVKVGDIGPHAVIKLINNGFRPLPDKSGKSYEEYIKEKIASTHDKDWETVATMVYAIPQVESKPT